MVQEFRVGEVLETRRIIGHDIFHPDDEGDLGAVSVVALVEAGDLTEVGNWAIASCAAFEVSRQCGSVVGQVGDGGAPSVVGVGDVVQLDHHGGLFKVAVGDVARWVIVRHKSLCQVVRERVSPHSRWVAGRKVDSAKAITAVDHFGQFGNDLRQVRGPQG